MPRTRGKCAWSRPHASGLNCLNGPGKSPAARMIGMNRPWRERTRLLGAPSHYSSRALWKSATWLMGRAPQVWLGHRSFMAVERLRKSAPSWIRKGAVPTAYSTLVSCHRTRARPSRSLLRSTKERRSPEPCSLFRSRNPRPVYHRRPSLSEMSQHGRAPLAVPRASWL
jgi:hypothetical protein